VQEDKREPFLSKISPLIDSIIERYPKLLKQYRRLYIWTNWHDIVGDEISHISWPYSIDSNDKLLVLVEEPIWLQQLQFNKIFILKKINSIIEDFPIKDIRFKLGDVDTLRSNWQDKRIENNKTSISSFDITSLLNNLSEEERQLFDEIEDKELKDNLISLYLKAKIALG